MTRRVPVFVAIALGLVFTAGCRMKSDMNLKAVTVSSSAVYCLFDPSCAVTPTDSSTTPISMQAGGTAFVQSRTFAGKPGTPASGLYGYEYRIDLEKAVSTKVQVEEVGEITYMPCLRSIAFEFGPIIDTLDYDGDGEAGDLAYVVTSGGPGKIGIGSIERYHGKLTFNFDSPVCVGGSHSQGDSTFFFGLVSTKGPRSVEATIKETAGMGAASPKLKKNVKYKVQVYAPQV
ncbi:hypothetical protein [Candidatus Methylomirabilis sp.]|uniref:Lipoprotein n=1 Tax=Candidatus Methylomirabilis tolerans TaxID=3123416 RepID=A0AAJ1EJF0_9BACT|nr:hypothetical protein [Candidatus Methylomirabilis sp.]